MDKILLYAHIFSLLLIFGFLIFLLARIWEIKIIKKIVIVFSLIFLWILIQTMASYFYFSDQINLFLWKASFIAAYIMTVFTIDFVYALTGFVYWKVLRYALLLSIVPYSFFVLATNKVLFSLKPEIAAWGWDYNTGNLFIMVPLLFVLSLFYSIYLLTKKIIKTKKERERKQLVFILLGVLVPVIMGLTTNIILPLLNIPFPKLASLSMVGLVGFFMYAIYRFGAFDIEVARLKIKTRITVIFILIIAILSGFIFAYFHNKSSKILEKEVFLHLENVASSKKQRIDRFFEEAKHTITYLAGSNTFNALLSENKIGDKYQEVFHAAQSKISDLVTSNNDYLALSLLDREGNLLASSNQLQSSVKDKEIAKTLIEDKIIFSDLYYSENFQTAVMDIFLTTKNKNHPGIIKLIVDLSPLYKIMTDDIGQRETEESFLINREGLIITPLKHKEDAALKLNVGDKYQDCFESKPWLKQSMHQNYRGVFTEGLISYLPDTDWCFLVELDSKEISSYINKAFLNDIIFSYLFIIIISLIAGSFSARTITKPLEKLEKDIKIIERGNLNHKVGTKAKDEIGYLSRSFDRMTAAIKEAQAEVEKKVKEQSKEILKSKEILVNQQKAVLNVLEDVEEEKNNVSQEKEKINAILHSIGDAVVAINKNFEIIMFNEIAENISGYKMEEAVGKKYDSVLKMVNEKDGKTNNDFIEKVIKTGEPQEMPRNINLIKKNGEHVSIADSAAPLKSRDGKINGAVMVFRDVEKERAIDKAKTEFVSLASHQLRTPLTSINWYTEMILSGDAGKLKPEQKSYLEEIYKGNKRMVSLVNSLLNVSRLELGTFLVEPKEIDIKKLADQEIKALLPETKKKKINIVKKYDKKLTNYKADPKLLAMVFQNLLSNAVKYNNEGGKVELEIKKRKHDIQISVKDNGYGIPQKQQKNIFTKLFRADNVRQMDTEGTGLGLYIVKEIVVQAGGSIKFESEKGKGTAFYVSLPLEGMRRKQGTKTLD